jgi:tRNA(fMet)-specific endonuclease VapC
LSAWKRIGRNKVALDTNRYTDFARGEISVAKILESATQIYFPFIVVAELRAGFAAGTKNAANETLLNEFLKEKDVLIVYPDAGTLATYVSLFRDLRVRGKMIPINDLWIASIVLQHDFRLCTRDQHFLHTPQISLI